MLHKNHMEWVQQRGISHELADKLGLTTKSDGNGNWLVIPYLEHGKPVNHKYRLSSQKRHMMDRDAPLTVWNHDCLLDDQVQAGKQTVIITEGEWDAMAAMMAGYQHVISVPNGAPQQAVEAEIGPETDAERFRFLWRCRAILDKVGTFILATDGDEPGRILANELARRLGPERCQFIKYPEGCKDLNDVLMMYEESGVRHLIASAKPYPVKSLYKMSEFPEPPAFEPLHLGITGLADRIPICRASLTVMSGYAGAGKTSLIVNIVAKQIKQGRTVAMGSFETMPKPILQRKLRAALIECNEMSIPVGRIEWADELIEKHFVLIANNAKEEDEIDLDEMIELCRIAVLRDGAAMVIIDPWNEIEHRRRDGEDEHGYTNRAIRRLKKFMRDYDVALWVIAHPRKPDMSAGKLRLPSLYDVSGSAHWANKADYGLIVWRPNKETNEVEAYVTKVRMGYPGKEGMVKLAYDWRFATYSPVEVEEQLV